MIELSHQIAIGVFGISGVGKSTLLAALVSTEVSYAHVEASALIRAHLLQPAIKSDDLRTLSPDKILGNQTLLSEAFAAWRKAAIQSTIFLDAHSVIDSPDGLIAVPTEIVKSLRLAAIIFIRGAGDDIVCQRQSDTKRTRPALAVAEILTQQDAALTQCQTYSKCLKIPLLIISPGDLGNLKAAISLIKALKYS